VLYEWNETKRQRNLAKHSVDFSAIESFVWEEAVVAEDTRQNYGETRYTAFGPINGRLHCLYFTIRGESYRIIGLRKANSKEVKKYG
jgi:uncharacterized DUF497 family protein